MGKYVVKVICERMDDSVAEGMCDGVHVNKIVFSNDLEAETFKGVVEDLAVKEYASKAKETRMKRHAWWEWFRTKEKELFKVHGKKHLLIHDFEVVETSEDFFELCTIGNTRFGAGRYLVQQCLQEPVRV